MILILCKSVEDAWGGGAALWAEAVPVHRVVHVL